MNNILIYTEEIGQLHVETVRLVFDQLRKHKLFANLKKILVSSVRGPISWLYCLSSGDPNEGGENQGYQGLAKALINLGY